MGRCRGVLCPHVHKEVLPKRNPKNQNEQRTKNKHEKKIRHYLGGIQCTRYLLGGIQHRRYLLGDIQCRRYLLSRIQCWWYLLGGIESWRYSSGGIESWRYFLAVSRSGGTFLTEAVKPKYGGIFSAVMQYGGNASAVGGFSFLGGNTSAVGGITNIWR